MRNLALVGALLLVLAACGTDDGRQATDPAGDAPSPPSAVPAADGEVTGVGTVLDTGRPELCLGPVAESWPPQCRGIPITGWDWSGRDGMFERSGDVRWGTFAVTGTFDGTTITMTRPPIPGALHDTVPTGPGEDALATPCDEPAGGWQVVDPERATDAALEQVFQVASQLDGYAGAWMDQSVAPADTATEPAPTDPTRIVINVQVTGDVAAAEQELRRVWGGALCVTRARRTETELSRIAEDLMDLPGALSSSGQRDRVLVDVVFDDGSLQAWADEAYGADLVLVTSALKPAATP